MVVKLLIILFLAPFFVNGLIDPAFNDDVLGLIVFKAGLIDPESKLASWTEEADNACNFVGIKCESQTNRVTELALDGFSLSGHISGRSLLRLQFLRVVSLSKNNFTGVINPVLAQIEKLRSIDLSENGLTGSIPEELFRQCGSLRSISLAKNNLSGIIPYSLSSCSTLETVNFSSNQLSGPLPAGLWSLTALRSIDLSNNLLEGQIPSGIESLYDLRAINLGNNMFSGQLPEDIGDCLLLKSVDFSGNSLSGYLPTSMLKLSLCDFLNLSANSFTGELPIWVGDMRSLEALDLSSNSFNGEIPSSLGDLQFLKELNMSKNQFNGSLPESLSNCYNLFAVDVSQNQLSGNLSPWIFERSLKIVSFSGNKLNGTIDQSSSSAAAAASMAASYHSLEVLDLSSNEFSGEIPLFFGNFSGLEFLNMSGNSLTGPFPANLAELNGTRVLDLSHNRLNGRIPEEIGKSSSLTSLILSWNNLTGPFPAITNLTNLQIVDLSFNNLTGNLPKELSNLSRLLIFNVSHNRLHGELPAGGFFNTIDPSSVSSNPSLCGSILNHSCPSVHPKPIVLNPNSSSDSAHQSLPTSLRHKRIALSISALIAIGAAVFIAIGVLAVTILNFHARASISRSEELMKSSGRDDMSHSRCSESNYGKLVMFSGDGEFESGGKPLLNKDSEIGSGGFGTVYQAVLRDGRFVAIKRLNASGLIKSGDDFDGEIRKLGMIKHPNLVSIEGYYRTPSLQLLINEFAPAGSLYGRLYGSDLGLNWDERFNILLGAAKGIAHLHRLNVIHYNIKSANVLIGGSGEAKVGDFGLVRLLPVSDRYVLSAKIQSALGYMAPEFACQTVKITEKCDVYGFGVLVLEVVTGKKPVEYMEDDVVVLCDTVRGAVEEGRVEEVVDGRLQGGFPAEEAVPVVKLGLICASQLPSNRPDMEEVVRILEMIRCPEL